MTVPPLQKRFGHRGVALLRIAVLEVLYNATLSGECIGGAEIGRRAGIFREPGYATKQGNDYIVWGVLNSLVKDNYLDKCEQSNGKPGWKLTDEVFRRRDAHVKDTPSWGGDKRVIQAYKIKQWGFCPGCISVLPDRPDIDHVKPKSKGGLDDAENKQLLCPNCNRRRGNMSFDEFILKRLADGDSITDYVPDFDKD